MPSCSHNNNNNNNNRVNWKALQLVFIVVFVSTCSGTADGKYIVVKTGANNVISLLVNVFERRPFQ